MKRIIGLAVVAVALACSDPVAPTPQLEFTLGIDTVRVAVVTATLLQPGGYGSTMRFTVPITVRNASNYPIVLDPCGPTVWRESPDSLDLAWHSNCTWDSPTSVGDAIPAGGSRELTYGVDATITEPGLYGEWRSPTVDGTFRFELDFAARSAADSSKTVARGRAVSNTFHIVRLQ